MTKIVSISVYFTHTHTHINPTFSLTAKMESPRNSQYSLLFVAYLGGDDEYDTRAKMCCKANDVSGLESIIKADSVRLRDKTNAFNNKKVEFDGLSTCNREELDLHFKSLKSLFHIKNHQSCQCDFYRGLKNLLTKRGKVCK